MSCWSSKGWGLPHRAFNVRPLGSQLGQKKKQWIFLFLLSLFSLSLSLSACFDSACTFRFCSSDFCLNLARISFLISKREAESEIMPVRKRERKEQDTVCLDLMWSDGPCVGCDASACRLSSSGVFFPPICAGRKWLFYSDSLFYEACKRFLICSLFFTIFPSHGRAADPSLQGDGSRSIRMHE